MEFDLVKNLFKIKFKVALAIGITIFLVIICAWYYITYLFKDNSSSDKVSSENAEESSYIEGGSGFLQKPVKEGEITARMYYPSGGYHGAIDYGVSVGTPVYAGADGVIVKTANLQTSYGTFVVIQHENGIQTWYAHGTPNSILVTKGQKVNRGQQIMLSGNSGHSTGPHLHFEVRKSPYDYNTCRVDPQLYM